MQALAIKYRPKMFNDVVEQVAIKQILQAQLETNTQKNCYLFTGGAGTGKTTCARIFANEINDGKGSPIEIDAASNNGVDNVRDIIENAKYKALDSMYKVYIIDECHMLSTGAWNAMLKLIEEPPAKTIFIFCTTDPQKIPATILSRVQRYDFHRITFASIVAQLKLICEAEAKEFCNIKGNDFQPGDEEPVNYTNEAIEYIAKLADGGMRDAITLLDKCISYNKELCVENVVAALGAVDYEVMFDLTDSMLARETATAIKIIEGIHRRGLDLKQFVKQYSWFLIDVYKHSLLQTFDFIQIPTTYKERLKDLDEAHKFILHSVSIFNKLAADIKWETSPKPMIEATVILLSEEE